MITETSQALNALKAIIEIAKMEASSKVASQIADKVIPLQSLILSLEAQCFDLQAKHHLAEEENRKLRQQLAEREQWEVEAAKYQLLGLGYGAFVYAAKPDNQSEEPMHWLCPHCYQQQRKSILQRTDRCAPSGAAQLACPACEKVIVTNAFPGQ